MSTSFDQLKSILAEINDLNRAIAVLSWDQETYMPAGAAEARGDQLATLGRIAHIKFTAPEVGALLETLKQEESASPDSDEARLVKVTTRNYEKATRVPPEFVAELAKVTTLAHEAWVKARAETDFAVFRPHLEKIVALTRRYIGFFPPAEHPYDVLLDDYEPGMKTADVQAIFTALRPQQVALIQAIADRPQVDDSFLHQHFPEKGQWDFGTEVITRFGYDWGCGRQDKAVHPFTIGIAPTDVRITTRVDEGYLSDMFFSTIHEAGHALYELGLPATYERTPLGNAASLAFHESQSRMWENLVGRSLPFWEGAYPRLQEIFPDQLGGVGLEAFYKGINKVSPSLIRVDADEATYNLHIMLRLEIEIGLIEGSIAVKDLPDAWNTRMQEYLGLTPPNDALGVLQDIHWSGGSIGYFSTYALGNLIASQLWEQIHRDIPDLEHQMRCGDFAGLLGWLRTNVHGYGCKYEPQELVQKVTGSKIDPAPYLRYLKGKYGEIYGL
ncbi:MAG: carboxypeptidase M32 [Chloroflexota bacterium]